MKSEHILLIIVVVLLIAALLLSSADGCTDRPFRYEQFGIDDYSIQTMTNEMSADKQLANDFKRGHISALSVFRNKTTGRELEINYRSSILNRKDWRVDKAQEIITVFAGIIENRLKEVNSNKVLSYCITYYIEVNSITIHLDTELKYNEKLYQDIVKLLNEKRGSLCQNYNPFVKNSEMKTKM